MQLVQKITIFIVLYTWVVSDVVFNFCILGY